MKEGMEVSRYQRVRQHAEGRFGPPRGVPLWLWGLRWLSLGVGASVGASVGVLVRRYLRVQLLLELIKRQ